MESVALLTKSIGIVTPLVLSIVVVVAPRLISYSRNKTRSYRIENQDEIVSYRKPSPDHIVQGFSDGNWKK